VEIEDNVQKITKTTNKLKRALNVAAVRVYFKIPK